MSDSSSDETDLNATFVKRCPILPKMPPKNPEDPLLDPKNTADSVKLENEVESVNYFIPKFWLTNPVVWFARTEAIFKNRRIKADSTKYNLVLEALPEDVLEKISDLIIDVDPEVEVSYDDLKKQVLSRLSLNEEERINRLLYRMEIGDQKPSEFYRKMVSLAGNSSSISEKLIFNLWVKRLPKIVECSIIPMAKKEIKEILEVADNIFDATKTASVFEVVNSGWDPQPNVSAEPKSEVSEIRSNVGNLEAKIDHLEKMISDLTFKFKQFSRSASRSRSRSRHANASKKDSDFCYYHATYGDNAHKCQSPCSYKSKPSNSKNQKND